MVTVTAIRNFPHDGRTVRAGERVTMHAVHAAAAARRGDVSLAPVDTYDRRDLRAHTPDASREAGARPRNRSRRRPDADTEPQTPSQGRSYDRRDLTADDSPSD